METVHRSVADLVHARGGGDSTLRNNVSRHVLPASIPFSTLNTLLTLIHESDPALVLLIGTSGGKLILSIKAEAKRKKRVREETEADPRVEKKLVGLEGSGEEVERAREALTKMLALSGSASEPVVQALTIERKALAGKPRHVIAARLHAGVAVPLRSIKDALGSGWADGAVTTEASFPSIDVAFPSVTEEGRAAEDVGERSCVVVCAMSGGGD